MKKFLTCRTAVNRTAIERTNIGGVEHIIVKSWTMPDDVVMNGTLYPKMEIENSYRSLNRTIAPISHPHDEDGNFISASDPLAINEFYAGAWNDNAQRVGNRISLDKIINVQQAKTTDRGKRLLDRIADLENNENATPIHTSTGIFVELETFDAPKTNADGKEFTSIARNLEFDHDAILLDEVGAATPDDGVGMAVNGEESIDVESVDLDKINLDLVPFPMLGDLPNQPSDMPEPARGISFFTLMTQLQEAGNGAIRAEWLCVADMFQNIVIYETEAGFFEAEYIIDANEKARLTGIPNRVDRVVSYQPKQNARESEMFKDAILNALKDAGKEVDGLTDEQLLANYNEMLADNTKPALEPDDSVVVRLSAIEDKLAQNADAERASAVKTITENGLLPGLSEDDIAVLPLATLKNVAATSTAAASVPGVGLNFANHSQGEDDSFGVPADMPA